MNAKEVVRELEKLKFTTLASGYYPNLKARKRVYLDQVIQTIERMLKGKVIVEKDKGWHRHPDKHTTERLVRE